MKTCARKHHEKSQLISFHTYITMCFCLEDFGVVSDAWQHVALAKVTTLR